MSATRFTLRFAVLGAAAMLALAGCGSGAETSAADPASSATVEESTSVPSPEETSEATTEPDGSASASKDTEGWVSCSKVWVADQELPGRYPGCLDGEVAVGADRLGCSSGQGMIRFDDRFYAVPGGTIYQTDTALSEDRGYRAAVAICRG